MTQFNAPLQTSLLDLFAQHNFARTDADLLQPVDVFLDLSGEDIRKRLYLTSDANGAELCLRPEYTIPVARHYLASNMQGKRAEFCYSGSVFRHRANESGEFTQAGVESFGRDDEQATDGEILSLALEASSLMGLKSPKTRIGDVALIEAVLGALNIPAPIQRKILRCLAANRPYLDALTPLDALNLPKTQNGLSAYGGVLTALKGTDPAEARAFVKDLLSIAGIHSVGGRSTADIATRFLAQSETANISLNSDAQFILDAFLKLEGNPDVVSVQIRKIMSDAKLDLNTILDQLDARIGFIAASNVDVTQLNFQTRFVRNLDYYSGFIFEIESNAANKPAVAGGRYDTLLGRLGAHHAIPAIGFSSWLDRSAAYANEAKT
jgi:ATP phosphoribosyltransferase regulatory subunit